MRGRPDVATPSPRGSGIAQQRILDAAMDLYFEHGVGGTSLQMIADRAGLTKAAVYYHFQAKEDIVLAVITPALDAVARLTEAAAAARNRSTAVDILITGLVDLVLENRRLGAVLWADPTIAQILIGHPARREIGARIHAQLIGPNPDAETRVRAAIFGSSLRIAASPELAEMDTEILRRHMIDNARRLIGVRAPRPVA